MKNTCVNRNVAHYIDIMTLVVDVNKKLVSVISSSEKILNKACFYNLVVYFQARV